MNNNMMNLDFKEMEYSIEDKVEILAEGKCYNYQFYIISYGTHPCSYVVIPKEHKYYGVNYNDCDIRCHGGLTFSRNYLLDKEKNTWVLGWDYAHIGDYNGIYDDGKFGMPELNDGAHKWTTKELLDEVIEVCRQLREVE